MLQRKQWDLTSWNLDQRTTSLFGFDIFDLLETVDINREHRTAGMLWGKQIGLRKHKSYYRKPLQVSEFETVDVLETSSFK